MLLLFILLFIFIISISLSIKNGGWIDLPVKEGIFGKPYHVEYLFDSREVLYKKIKFIEGYNHAANKLFELPTKIEYYSKTHKIKSIWKNGDLFYKNNLLFFLEKKTDFKIGDINYLYSKFSDADFMKRFIKPYNSDETAEKYRGMNKADSLFWFLQKIFYWNDEVFPEKPKYLDVGCGEGYITESLGEMLEAREICGLELNYNYVTGEKKTLSKSFIKFIDKTEKFPYPDKYFDFISCILSLHHFEERDHMLIEIKRVLKPNGYLLLREHSVNNCMDLMFVELEHIFFFSLLQQKGDFYARYYSGYTISNFLQEYGFEFFKELPLMEYNRKGNRKFSTTVINDYLYKLKI